MVTFETVPSSSVLLGKPGEISAILSLTLLIASSGFAPYLATTTPPTASAPPLSKPPLRVAGPKFTLATSLILIGTLLLTATTLSSRSSRFLIYPSALYQIFNPVKFNGPGPDIKITVFDSCHNLGNSYTICLHGIGINIHLVFLHKSTDRCHFGNAFG